jgi:histidinol dehydrogenase
MLAVPAMIAGVERLVMTSPPGPDGKINPVVLAAASLCGITEIYAIGGAQAIGAMAYGTKQIPRVDKIFGPGNQWVTMAKQLVSQEPGGPAVDMPAGPSEVMILVDADANPAFVAADLLAQAEHDPLSQVMLLSLDVDILKSIESELTKQLTDLPRKDIAQAALENSRAIIVSDQSEAARIINLYASEHLIIQTSEPRSILPLIRNAGSIFLGSWTPEALGDYASGTNHVLPTAGGARAWSGLSVESFMKYISVQTCSKSALKQIGPTVEALAAAEELDAHKRSVSIRLEQLS